MLKLKTSDGKIFEIEESLAKKSIMLGDVLSLPATDDIPLEIPVSFETLDRIHKFMKGDNHVLDKDYNPLEIHFPYEMIMHFEDLSASQLLGVCNAANY
ncbi:hypothetical protein ENBRE01_2793, partial [Enteropsectra breve]